MPIREVALETNLLTNSTSRTFYWLEEKYEEYCKRSNKESLTTYLPLPETGYTAIFVPSLRKAYILFAHREKTRLVGGIDFYKTSPLAVENVAIHKKHQGKGLMLSLYAELVKTYGELFSSDSISPGASITWMRLGKKSGDVFIAWYSAKVYARVVEWKEYRRYSKAPFIKAPNGELYCIFDLERKNLERSHSVWLESCLYVSKTGNPPQGYRPMEGNT